MKNRKPINIYNGLKSKKVILNRTNLVSIKAYQSSYNVTKPFVKPISKII
jgi:hypothetical protein